MAAKQKIQAILDEATANPTQDLPNAAFYALDRNGTELAANYSGKRGLDKDQPNDVDTVNTIFSCTKLLTAIAVMQLVEQGKLSLDDPQHIEKILPELKDRKVINDDLSLTERKGDITLRSLMTHTSGYSYNFLDEKLHRWEKANDLGASDTAESMWKKELRYQPNTAWAYSIGIDFAGIAIERVSGKTLDAYFNENIFKPSGVDTPCFWLNEKMHKNRTTMSWRQADGYLATGPHLFPLALTAKSAADLHNGGGHGCWMTIKDYVTVISPLTNDGVSPITGTRILSKASVDEMTKNSIPQWPDFARKYMKAGIPAITNDIPELYPQKGNPPQGWSMAGMYLSEKGDYGCAAGTVCWSGLSNVYWWVDRATGIAAVFSTQVLPFWDKKALETRDACEKALYDGLSKEKKVMREPKV